MYKHCNDSCTRDDTLIDDRNVVPSLDEVSLKRNFVDHCEYVMNFFIDGKMNLT